jgi:hypothetical protein
MGISGHNGQMDSGENATAGRHSPVPHACSDPDVHQGPMRLVGPAEWDRCEPMSPEGWFYSSGRGTRYVNPETGAVVMFSAEEMAQMGGRTR